MKVKILQNYRLEDSIDDGYTMSPIIFSKGDVVEVVYTFQDGSWGIDDHTVFVVLNKEGYSLTLAKDVVEVVENV